MTKRGLARLAGMTLATAVGVAACGGPAKPSGDLAKDLDAASAASSASSLTLAPTTGQRDVISAVERSPEARRAPAPARAELVTYRAPLPAATSLSVTPAAITPAQTVAAVPAAVLPAPAPVPMTQSRRPMQQQTQPGRYKTEAEVFRNAPFPITP